MIIDVECNKCRKPFQMDFVVSEFMTVETARKLARCDKCAGIGPRQKIKPQLALNLPEVRLPYPND